MGHRSPTDCSDLFFFWQMNLWKICEKHLGSIKEIFLFLFWKPGCKIVPLGYSDTNNIGSLSCALALIERGLSGHVEPPCLRLKVAYGKYSPKLFVLGRAAPLTL